MDENLIKIYTHLPAKKADLIILILTSQHIENRVEKENNLFHILVNEKDANKAVATIETYYKENKFFRLKQKLQEFPISSFKSLTAFIIMGLLCGIHATCIHTLSHENMILKYGASALFILQGETYRAITALFLHSNAQHLIGNMAGMLIFGAPLISLAGFGMGPFMLLFAGTLGNLLNAYLYQSAHLSIGASTSIMGAAGLLAAYQITQKGKPLQLNNFMPLIAGAVLVGMFSHGENTDVWAHVLGFLCGLFPGIIFFPLNRTIQFPQKEGLALFTTLGILALALLSTP
ncbi:MAG: rhomboid family intramembrane serine protease [Desulfobacteraceae bacterium]|nr:rhomboid family intramembrane serine protease [Desulfobacteraceae bacterium]